MHHHAMRRLTAALGALAIVAGASGVACASDLAPAIQTVELKGDAGGRRFEGFGLEGVCVPCHDARGCRWGAPE